MKTGAKKLLSLARDSNAFGFELANLAIGYLRVAIKTNNVPRTQTGIVYEGKNVFDHIIAQMKHNQIGKSHEKRDRIFDCYQDEE